MLRRALRKMERMPEWLQGRLPNRGAILIYHRVGPSADDDPFGIAITAEHFQQHLEILSKHAHPMSLEQMHDAVAARNLPRGAVAVTLDDGYIDTLTVAKPLLARNDVPATAFIVSGQVGNPRGFWWDELHRVIAGPAVLPERLELEIRETRHRWRLVADADLSTRLANRFRAERHVTREQLFWQLYGLLLPLTQEEWLRAQDRLLAWSGARAGCDVADRPMNVDELLALGNEGLVEIGAHSVSHPQLPGMSAGTQLQEARACRGALEEITGRAVHSFAYPHGSFDARTVAAVHGAGFRRACTTIPNRVTPAAHPHRLPRIDVPDCDGETFARSLHWLLNQAPA